MEKSVNSTTNVLITGAARRIGRAIAEDLSAHGFGVAIHCNHSRNEAEQLASIIGERGGRAVVVQADLADLDATARLFGQAEAAIGPISILVNNASLFEDDSIRDFAWDLWDRHFDVHLKAPALLARSLDAALPSDGQGLIVNIIDQRVWRPTPRYFSYTLSKSALWTATQTMAQALAPRVRVNAIGPGPTLANSRQQPEDFRAQVDGLILGYGPVLAEFGATVRYLWQTRSVTGQMIALDGGQHLAWQTPDVTGMKE